AWSCADSVLERLFFFLLVRLLQPVLVLVLVLVLVVACASAGCAALTRPRPPARSVGAIRRADRDDARGLQGRTRNRKTGMNSDK
ncbi:MAG: hypothetical protein ABF759_13460, partial [Acetobacter malorum]|uniref:hypothetical protein n=1 Tax=Acetobacter malorum TaxID=178901 RepID=UPI0039EB65F1